MLLIFCLPRGCFTGLANAVAERRFAGQYCGQFIGLNHIFHERIAAYEICALATIRCSQSFGAAYITPCSRLPLRRAGRITLSKSVAADASKPEADISRETREISGLKTLESRAANAGIDNDPLSAIGGKASVNRQIIDGAISFHNLLALAEARPVFPVFNSVPENCSGHAQAITGNMEPWGIVLNREYDLPGASFRQADLVSVLKDIFQSEGVPHNFIWLAEVESAMNPEAESSAGAMGLFQLMPDTAKRFGLKIFPDDDRKTPEKSARAAACYLRHLRDEFGCWALALAAYNAGEGRVSRAMKLNNARTFREVAPHLPSETRRYVPRVMTTIALREDQRHGVSAAIYMP